MKKGLSTGVIALLVLAGVVLVFGGWVMSTYNGFVTLRNSADTGWAQIETQYQRRADLIPQLVATVEGAADFEQGVLTAVTEARTNWLNAASGASIDDEMAASSALDSALSRLLVTVEAYPTLTATEGFITLQSQLEGTENRIAVARADYNELVRQYNTATDLVPGSIVAGFFSFDDYPFFEAAQGSEAAPVIDFSDDK